jgi:hypothetical protein
MGPKYAVIIGAVFHLGENPCAKLCEGHHPHR